MHSWQVDPGASADPETQAAEGALVDAYLAREVERVRGWLARIGDEPAEWTSGALLNESVLLLTADELKSVNAEVMRLIEPYKRRHRVAGPPEGARATTCRGRPLSTRPPARSVCWWSPRSPACSWGSSARRCRCSSTVRAISPSSRRDFSCVPEETLELARSRQQPADRAWRGGCARIRWCWR
ncbi:hypothetical protein GCM10027575_02220 [Phytohabitans suffuscus]